MNLNRVFLKFKATDDVVLNYNYNYSLLQTIYKAYSLQDKIRAKHFHDEGYNIENKKFNLINNCLIFENSKFTKDGIEIQKDEIIKIMLSGNEDDLNNIVKGLIKMNIIEIKDCKFKIEEIEQDKNVKFKRQMLYKVLTTVVESVWNEGKVEYLSIYDNRFYEALAQNLKRKYKLIYEEDFKDELYFDIENVLNVKKKDICGIKNNGYIKGYGNFNMWIETSMKMQKVIYYCGLGQNNTLGAGTLMHLTSK